MGHGLHESQVQLEEKVHKRKVVDLGPIMLDAERCVLCSRCLRFERRSPSTNSLQFVNRGDQTQIATYENRPIAHEYAGNLADVCPVGALLSHDFRFKMRVWFLKETHSVCPGCSTGCNIYLDHRDGEAQRFRPRRNVEVNKSWMCDPGRALYKEIGSEARVSGARLRQGGRWEGVASRRPSTRVAEKLRAAGEAGGLPGLAAGHQRGPLRRSACWRAARVACSTSAWATRRNACSSASTTCCSAPTATPTPRAAWIWAWAQTAWTRSSTPAAPARCRRWCCRGPSCCGWPGPTPRSAGPVRGRHGDPRGARARRAPRRSCRPPCGPRSTARSPTTSAACSGSGAPSRPRARPGRAGSWPRRCCAAGRAARGRLGARGLRTHGRRAARATPGSTTSCSAPPGACCSAPGRGRGAGLTGRTEWLERRHRQPRHAAGHLRRSSRA